ncbi:hypothetical protein [Paraburkholderia sartisoli]|uniref:hypothetical protein n=1 Tax=Paraburkholderia sartisoli TaxID=83784 RepID=UPI002ADD541D|nr:hypothetical protein [Paraburkholderia sartisoli]
MPTLVNSLKSVLRSLPGPGVTARKYGSKSGVLREGVWLTLDRKTPLATLDASIFRSVEDTDNGRTKPAGEVFD